MSRISAAHIGIEQLSAITLEELSLGLPGRYALPPDGHSIEPHLERLYPGAPSERTLWAFATPEGVFHELHRARDFQRELDALLPVLAGSESPLLRDAASVLESQQQELRLLQMTLNLLHKV
ncbi:type III secretion apparatus assembly protein SctX [Aeromonas schubertii]|uniref:type III secretion apparatus assembly protein SctX n=1 Tax=Aeromonas schubertii TaxID=652 RepID=UPI00067F4F31|nr:YscX family type III secretion protein [Aeromonas schubertii]KUE80845.1 hypothetical protein ATO46_14865 [Aeromonas schubertii]MBZ6074313.1 YscX family type III secretion protein [Aeromonas schubertii]QCG47951.1 YscX family type III secretion protein [Aeromonas schubertii]